MIDLLTEELLPLDKARRHKLALNAKGQPPCFGTILNWVENGIKGVCLESVRKPGGIYTSELALVRFLERLSMPVPSNKSDTPSQRKKAIDHANAVLDSILAPKRRPRVATLS